MLDSDEGVQMLLFDGAFGLIFFAVWVFCIIDVITTPSENIRNLPKLVWLLIVILLVDIGSIAWLIAGRDWTKTSKALASRPAQVPARPSRPSTPDDDEEFLAGLRHRAEEQRRRARETKDDDPTG